MNVTNISGTVTYKFLGKHFCIIQQSQHNYSSPTLSNPPSFIINLITKLLLKFQPYVNDWTFFIGISSSENRIEPDPEIL